MVGGAARSPPVRRDGLRSNMHDFAPRALQLLLKLLESSSVHVVEDVLPLLLPMCVAAHIPGKETKTEKQQEMLQALAEETW